MDRMTVGSGDDVASADELGDGHADRDAADRLDLSPRPAEVVHGRRRPAGSSGRKWPWLVVVAALVVGISFVISRAITDATQFYLPADEAVAKQAEMGTRPFRLEGSVVEGSRQNTADGVNFKATAGGVTINVHHVGDPPQLFQECIPVVVEGSWRGAGADAVFESRSIIVAHEADYEAKNSDRIAKAKAEGAKGSAACVMRAANAQ